MKFQRLLFPRPLPSPTTSHPVGTIALLAFSRRKKIKWQEASTFSIPPYANTVSFFFFSSSTSPPLSSCRERLSFLALLSTLLHAFVPSYLIFCVYNTAIDLLVSILRQSPSPLLRVFSEYDDTRRPTATPSVVRNIVVAKLFNLFNRVISAFFAVRTVSGVA